MSIGRTEEAIVISPVSFKLTLLRIIVGDYMCSLRYFMAFLYAEDVIAL